MPPGEGYSSTLGAMCRSPPTELSEETPETVTACLRGGQGALTGVTPAGDTGHLWLSLVQYAPGTEWVGPRGCSAPSAQDGRDVSSAEGQTLEQGPGAGWQESQTPHHGLTLKEILKIVSKHILSGPHFPEKPIPGMGLGPGPCILGSTPPSLALISRGWQRWGAGRKARGPHVSSGLTCA